MSEVERIIAERDSRCEQPRVTIDIDVFTHSTGYRAVSIKMPPAPRRALLEAAKP